MNFFNTLTTDHRTTFLFQDCSLSSYVLFTLTRLKRLLLFIWRSFFLLFIFSNSLTLCFTHACFTLNHFFKSMSEQLSCLLAYRFLFHSFEKGLVFLRPFWLLYTNKTWSLCYRLWFCLQATYCIFLTFFAQRLNWVDSRQASTSSFLLLGTSPFILLTHQYKHFTPVDFPSWQGICALCPWNMHVNVWTQTQPM